MAAPRLQADTAGSPPSGEDLAQKFRGYTFRINWNSSEPYDAENEALNIRIMTRDGDEYSGNFTTRQFLDYIFEKNRRTGECASGTYFCMPGMVVVEKLTEEKIKRTIDNLIDDLSILNYFQRLED